MKSAYSQEVSGATGPEEQPSAPVFVSRSIVGNGATLVYILPTTQVNGAALAPGSYSKLVAYADKKTFLGRLEELVGMEPKATMAVDQATQAGQQVAITISDLEFNVADYRFIACVE